MASPHRLAKRQQQNMDAILASLARIESHLGIDEFEEDSPRAFYESMTIDELRRCANEAEINLKGVVKKSGIIDTLMLSQFPEEAAVN